MTLPIWAYAGVGSLLAGALAGWTVRDWKADSDALEAENKAHAQFVAMSEALAEQSLQYEHVAQQLRTAERADRENIRTIYRDKIVPAECAADPAVGRVLSEAVARTNAATAGELGGEVSRPAVPARTADRPRPR